MFLKIKKSYNTTVMIVTLSHSVMVNLFFFLCTRNF